MAYNIPSYVETIINSLEKTGYNAFLVGGSIRDIIIGKKPSDYDISTDAKPDEIKEVFKEFKTIEVGKKFGTIIVVQEEGAVEVTTFRREGEYKDGRRPEFVSFSKDIKEDLNRRDFTINAMAYNEKTGVIDPFGGKGNLENKIIKTVGNPENRFREDYLRIIRAVRFAAQLNFDIDEETYLACNKYKDFLLNISIERVRDELFKILLCEKPSNGIELLKDLGILKIFLPEIIPAIDFNQHNPHHDKDVYNHILCVLDNTPPVLQVRIGALFHDIGKPHTLTIDNEGVGHFYGHDKVGAEIVSEVLRRWKCSNELIEKVSTLVREHMTQHANYKEKGLKKLIARVGEDEIFNLLALQKADRSCSNEKADISSLLERENKIKDILYNKEAYNINQLDLDGRDILELGYKEGKIIGEILDYLLEQVMEKPDLNKKDLLIKNTLKKFPLK
ncbi:HD domain-containing protein [Tissierella sp. MSJ-40]|uniref:HD domain-containing protein n=1 Tax=Tissierella simiarum TaxID=2841534 RepID=A0ABS6EAK4_9FIRM|nr:HD domain-containing protein [Tissierella simiarum]MBU5439967.1 HD domain-containing protein [Tissierella simiarum]